MDVLSKIALSYKDKSRDELNLHMSHDWCAETVMDIVKRANIPAVAKNPFNISCTQSHANAIKTEYWYEPEDDMQVGDIIYYNWGHNYDATGNLDHTGVIVGVYANYIEVIEGNTEGTGNDCKVRLKTRPRATLNFNCTYPDYYIRYKGISASLTEAEKTYIENDKSSLASYAQRLMKIADELYNIGKEMENNERR